MTTGGERAEFSEISRKKMSDSQKEFRKNNIHPLKGKTGKQNCKSKPLLCLTNGKVYESGRQAALQLNLNKSHVNAVAASVRKSTGKYKFKYI